MSCNVHQDQDVLNMSYHHLETKQYVLFRKDGNVLFNNTLNTLYLQLHRFRYIVKDH